MVGRWVFCSLIISFFVSTNFMDLFYGWMVCVDSLRARLQGGSLGFEMYTVPDNGNTETYVVFFFLRIMCDMNSFECLMWLLCIFQCSSLLLFRCQVLS